MSKYGISIIVPCYNAGEYLKDAVNSVVLQPFKNPYELIIIDDGSTDIKTKRVLEKIKKYKNVKVVECNNNNGVQYARNLGIKMAVFDYIMTLDADDVLNMDKNILAKGTYPDLGIKILKENNNVAFIHGLSYMYGEYSGYTISAYPVSVELALKKHHIPTSIIFRKDDVINSSMYNIDIKKWQDWSFGIKILNNRFVNNKKNEILCIEQPYHLYRIHNNPCRISNSDISEKEMTKITVADNFEIFKEYFPNLSIDEIIEYVVINKPSKLVDLLYIASNNIDLALEIILKRKYLLYSESEPINIP